jgi:DeoR family transcriptional regulator, fructose operon transcriptional repressor
MFAAARQQQIREILLKHKQIDVITLAATLGVTEVTIRRDLDKLEKDGFVIKTHGGAILNESAAEENHATLPMTIPLEKREIGEVVSLLVGDREAVFVGSGLTCVQVAANLKNKQRLTVMTNDLQVAQELSAIPGVISVITGGNTLPGTNTLVGDLALRALKGIHFNKVIISVAGVDFSHGFTVNTVEEALLYQQLFNFCDEIIIAVDFTKFNRIGFSFLCRLVDVQKVVTNKEVDDKYKEFFFEQNIKVYTPYEVEESVPLS